MFSPSHRVWHDKPSTLAKYGIPLSQGDLYQDDERVPLCAVGDNAAPRNHWPQPWSEAERKDQLELLVCRRICDRTQCHSKQASASSSATGERRIGNC